MSGNKKCSSEFLWGVSVSLGLRAEGVSILVRQLESFEACGFGSSSMNGMTAREFDLHEAFVIC